MDDKLRNLLLLVKRSPKDSEGWCKVSANVWPLVADLPSDLVTPERAPDGGGRLQLTPRGQAVVDYL